MTTNVALLALEVLAIGGGALLLHAAGSRYGLAPVLLYLAGLVATLHSLSNTPVIVEAWWGQEILVSDVLLVPTILMTLMILYEADGTAVARVSIAGILGVSLLVLGVQIFRAEHLSLPGGVSTLGFTADDPVYARSWSTTAASMLAFVMSLTAIVTIYQSVRNLMPVVAGALAPGLALVGALAVDDVVFRITAFGWDNLAASFPAGIPGKAAAGILLWPMAAAYLSRVRRRSGDPEAMGGRASWDLLFGSYGHLHVALRTTEASRRHTEARLHTVVEHAPIVMFGIDADGRFILSEGAGLAALGLEPGQVVGQSAFDLFPEAVPHLRRALDGESLSTILDVGELSYDVTYVPIREDGSVTGVIGVATDISMRRKAERALDEIQLRFRSTFEQAAVGLLHAEPSGQITLANRAVSAMLGYEDGELFEKTFLDLISPEDRPECERGIRSILSGSEDEFEAECRYHRKDGVPVWAHTTVSPVRSESGEPRYLIIATEDLTERRATEEQLRQAQKMETVGQLTGGVAHDFNNLLTVVIGGLEMALDDPSGPPESRGLLLDALRSAEKGAALTQQLLAFSRRQALRPTAIHMGELLQDMSQLLTRTLGETIQVVVDVSANTGRCVADRAQMESAILNLALNARDAMSRGGTLTLSARGTFVESEQAEALELEPGRYVRVEVTDTGGGMDPDLMDRAFDPFFTTKEVGKGSGLGLSMVYGFVRQSGGSIRLENSPGQGLTVCILLPAAADDDQGPGPEPGAGGRVALGGVILVVEDDAGVRAVVRRMIESLGYHVVHADRAEDAMEILRSRDDIALLLTDVVLPGRRSGPELVEEARALRPGLPAVLTSGYTGESLSDVAHLDEGVPLLEKPFHRERLARALVEALGTE